MFNFINEEMYGSYESAKARRRYISRSHKGYDKIKLAIYDYVLGLTSSVNNYLRGNYKWKAVTKYLDMAFNDPKYMSVGNINVYRTVEEDYLKNIYGITKENIKSYIGLIIMNKGYMSVASEFISPWGNNWYDSEVILHIVSNLPINYLDIDKIFEGDELPSGELAEILLPRNTLLKIIDSYLKFDEGLPKGNYEKFSPNGNLVIECEIVKPLKESLDFNILINEGECFGGVSGSYVTPMNTVGIGDITPAGINSIGSGDRFDMGNFPIAIKKNVNNNIVVKKRKRKKKKFKN